MENNLDISKPRFCEQLLPVPWHFVISKFQCIKATWTLHEVISSDWGFVKIEKILASNLQLSFGSCKRWPKMTRLGG